MMMMMLDSDSESEGLVQDALDAAMQVFDDIEYFDDEEDFDGPF